MQTFVPYGGAGVGTHALPAPGHVELAVLSEQLRAARDHVACGTLLFTLGVQLPPVGAPAEAFIVPAPPVHPETGEHEEVAVGVAQDVAHPRSPKMVTWVEPLQD
jgi:hypothetical protein